MAVRKVRVDDDHREWRKLNDGFRAHFIMQSYEKDYGKEYPLIPEGKWQDLKARLQYSWLGWHIFGGKHRNEIFRAYALGWKACERRALQEDARRRRNER